MADMPTPAPVPMLLFCPRCSTQHIDAPDERTPGWNNPPHRSHLCHVCGHTWRPADVPTNGVAVLCTKGAHDGSAAPGGQPDEPDIALLVSMATCMNHGFALLEPNRQHAMLQDMRKLWAEVAGRGFYSQATRDHYLGFLGAAACTNGLVPGRGTPGTPGCSCDCHRDPGVKHVAPCCYPTFGNAEPLGSDELEH